MGGTSVARAIVLGMAAWLPAAGAASGQAVLKPAANQSSDEMFVPLSVSLSPATEPVPALRYRLLPSVTELVPGDAAPIYLRLRWEMGDELWDQIVEKTTSGRDDKGLRWLEIPIDELPVEAARAFVNQWQNRLQQIKFGARRERCDWAYTLPEERENAITILLPDAQGLRNMARLLALKARVEIAEGKFDEAAETIETGIAFGRHLANAPFLISKLIGIAVCNQMLDQVEVLMSQPNAPSLYWALTTLPRPLVDLRPSMELEQKLLENMVPELIEATKDHTTEEWPPMLDRMLDRLARATLMMEGTDVNQGPLPEAARKAWNRAKVIAETLPEARKGLEASGMDAEKVKEMSDAEAVARYIAWGHQVVRDQSFKTSYLSHLERSGSQAVADAEAFMRKASRGPLRVSTELLPSVAASMRASVRIDRRVAALRAVEAIRLHAGSNDNQLPGSLEEVKLVPVPIDPATGRPFELSRDGEAALLVGGRIEGQPKTEVGYRIQLRDSAK